MADIIYDEGSGASRLVARIEMIRDKHFDSCMGIASYCKFWGGGG